MSAPVLAFVNPSKRPRRRVRPPLLPHAELPPQLVANLLWLSLHHPRCFESTERDVAELAAKFVSDAKQWPTEHLCGRAFEEWEALRAAAAATPYRAPDTAAHGWNPLAFGVDEK